jgi:hypothetical protein
MNDAPWGGGTFRTSKQCAAVTTYLVSSFPFMTNPRPSPTWTTDRDASLSGIGILGDDISNCAGSRAYARMPTNRTVILAIQVATFG